MDGELSEWLWDSQPVRPAHTAERTSRRAVRRDRPPISTYASLIERGELTDGAAAPGRGEEFRSTPQP